MSSRIFTELLLDLTKQICAENNIKPIHSRGQNFLINEEIYDQIIKAGDLKKNDIVLEVGPGLGFLTERLAEKVKKVIAVELDAKLVEILKKRLKEKKIKNVEIINQSILDYQLSIKNYKIIANLPYNITSFFLRRFLSPEMQPSLMVLMLQKEVAQRIVAQAPQSSLLSLSVQYYAQAEILHNVSAQDFWPAPKVDSAIIKIITNNKLQIYLEAGGITNYDEQFFRLIKAGFSAKRKMMKKSLSRYFKISIPEIEKRLTDLKLNPNARAQELSLEDWKKIASH